jgi:CDP-6-deoxy-D-xylo-4-hexulose-3-dehydrase
MRGRNYRVAGELTNADIVTERTFWIGLYPGLGPDHLSYAAETIRDFARRAHGASADAPNPFETETGR